LIGRVGAAVLLDDFLTRALPLEHGRGWGAANHSKHKVRAVGAAQLRVSESYQNRERTPLPARIRIVPYLNLCAGRGPGQVRRCATIMVASDRYPYEASCRGRLLQAAGTVHLNFELLNFEPRTFYNRPYNFELLNFDRGRAVEARQLAPKRQCQEKCINSPPSVRTGSAQHWFRPYNTCPNLSFIHSSPLIPARAKSPYTRPVDDARGNVKRRVSWRGLKRIQLTLASMAAECEVRDGPDRATWRAFLVPEFSVTRGQWMYPVVRRRVVQADGVPTYVHQEVLWCPWQQALSYVTNDVQEGDRERLTGPIFQTGTFQATVRSWLGQDAVMTHAAPPLEWDSSDEISDFDPTAIDPPGFVPPNLVRPPPDDRAAPESQEHGETDIDVQSDVVSVDFAATPPGWDSPERARPSSSTDRARPTASPMLLTHIGDSSMLPTPSSPKSASL
jgi:hypothetical protein